MDVGTFQQSLRESQEPRQRQAQLPARPQERAQLPRAALAPLLGDEDGQHLWHGTSGTAPLAWHPWHGTSGTAPLAAPQVALEPRLPLQGPPALLTLLYTANTEFPRLQLIKSRTERQLHLSLSRIILTAGPKMPMQGQSWIWIQGSCTFVPREGCAQLPTLAVPHPSLL